MAHCWKCWKWLLGRCDRLCPECYAAEVELVHRHDTVDEYIEVTGAYTVACFPPGRFRAPHSSGRRVIRKSEPMGG